MATALILDTDDHVGSTYGLWHPDADSDEEGGRHRLNFVQEYLWQCKQHALNEWIPKVCGDMPRILVTVGDIVDGVSPRSPVVTDLGNLQVEAAVKILEPLAQTCQAVYSVSGTLFHVGKSATLDNSVAKALGARPELAADANTVEGDIVKRANRFARWQLFLSVEGVTFDIAHHMPGNTVATSRATPLQREYIDAAMSVFENRDWPRPDWIIRGHSHRYRLWPQPECTVLSLPGFQGKTPYAHKLQRGYAFDVGMVVLVVDNGVVVPHVQLYKWPTPHTDSMEEVGWTANMQQPKSQVRTLHTMIGSVFSRMTK